MSFYIVPLSPNDHPTTAQGPQRLSEVTPKIAIFQSTHGGLKTAESSLVGPHKGGRSLNSGDSTRDPVISYGGPYRRRKWNGAWWRLQATQEPNHNQEFRGFWGAWATHGPSGHYVGPHGRSSSRVVIKRSPKPIPGAAEGFWKMPNFRNFSVPTHQPENGTTRLYPGATFLGRCGGRVKTFLRIVASVCRFRPRS